MASPSGTGGAGLLRDEATDWLLARLEGDPRAELTIGVEHGRFHATYEADGAATEGDWNPNLTDALCSLIGYFHAR